jgi:hypothetical protein
MPHIDDEAPGARRLPVPQHTLRDRRKKSSIHSNEIAGIDAHMGARLRRRQRRLRKHFLVRERREIIVLPVDRVDRRDEYATLFCHEAGDVVAAIEGVQQPIGKAHVATALPGIE